MTTIEERIAELAEQIRLLRHLPGPPLMTYSQAGEYLNRSESTVRRYVNLGFFPVVMLPSTNGKRSSPMIDPEDLLAFVAQCKKADKHLIVPSAPRKKQKTYKIRRRV